MILKEKDYVKLLKYPRPDFQRRFQSLDGIWTMQLCNNPATARKVIRKYKKEETLDTKKWQTIKVPFCIESEESGLKKRLHKVNAIYYRTFDMDKDFNDKVVHVNFGAIDHYCEIYLNGRCIGKNKGGYIPIRIPLERKLFKNKNNTFLVYVKDSLSKSFLRGKQAFTKENSFVHYTPVSGIWQPVWLENTGTCYLKNFKVYPGISSFSIELNFSEAPKSLKVELNFKNRKIAFSKKDFTGDCDGVRSRINIKYSDHKMKPMLWSPESPEMIPVTISIGAMEGKGNSDKVVSFVGNRTVVARGSSIYLNGSELYQRLILNQGYYPDGWYSPVNSSDYIKDIQLIKDAGFNGMRIHEKIEDPRFLFLCDVMGLLVWEEMPSPYIYNKNSSNEVERTVEAIVERDFNHPSIVTWVIYNESWGLYNILLFKKFSRVLQYFYSLVKQIDPTRLVIDNSGFFHAATDIIDVHHYIPDREDIVQYYMDLANRKFGTFKLLKFLEIFRKIEASQPPFKDKEFIDGGQPVIISEFGGFGFYETEDITFQELYKDWISLIREFGEIQGFCYTQFTDVEQEGNGLFTFKREPKIPIKDIKKITEI